MLVLALAVSSAAGADTFRVARPHTSGGSVVSFAPTSNTSAISFTTSQTGPMPFAALQSIWQAAGSAYGIPWQVLAAINKVETNFGQNLGPSSAGAVGWMQFMPSTWARWGVDANGDGVADPNNPTDAIFSAARYLAACGGQIDITRAVYCYNHATWYVNEVMGLAALYGQGAGTANVSTGTLFSSSVDLKPQLQKVRGVIAASKTQVAAASAKAHRLAHAERRLLGVASTAHLLSTQLEAHKRAILLGVRRSTVVHRVAQLRDRLRSATTRLGKLRDQVSTGQLLSAQLYGGLGATGQSGGVVSIAAQYLGIPYKWAGATPATGFDCSGLVQYVFAQLGVSLPHNTVAQWNSPNAVPVTRNQLQPGDLVFFANLDHVGIYIGNGYFIDAPHTGAFVRVDSLDGAWERANYSGARRIVGASLDGFQSAAGATNFSSDIVYFTH
ncbi:MAG TPA: bifunctional lytic transglycosylase/C40 family peptidase [Gaiellaceae bacterium]|jgi:cell wall-associated NlpC family hydrolase